MKVSELFNEGWFDKKEPKNEPITADDRKIIDAALKGYHNGHLKRGDEYLFPNNVHATTDDKKISFYKRDGILRASVGHHRRGEAGDPKKSPITSTDHVVKSVADIKKLLEAVAGPLKRFKKGQIVTVKKTGKKVEVLAQNDIGLVQTVSTDPADRKIKNWKDYSAVTLKRGLISGAGHQEYMPAELQEERAKWERQAQKLRDHAKKQYHIDLNEGLMTNMKSIASKLAKLLMKPSVDAELINAYLDAEIEVKNLRDKEWCAELAATLTTRALERGVKMPDRIRPQLVAAMHTELRKRKSNVDEGLSDAVRAASKKMKSWLSKDTSAADAKKYFAALRAKERAEEDKAYHELMATFSKGELQRMMQIGSPHMKKAAETEIAYRGM